MNIENYFRNILDKNSFIPIKDPSDDNIFSKFSELGINNNELLVVVEELVINAKEHGKAPVYLYLDKVFDYLFISVTDNGSGIHTTIPKNRNLKDTEGKNTSSILRLSLEEGITGTGIAGRGVGLFLLSNFCMNNNAETIVASNSGILYQQGQYYFTKDDKSFDITGTVICIKTKVF